MGHAIQHFDYDEKVNPRSIQATLDDYVSHETWREGGGGLFRPIRWNNTVCDDYESAIEYIEQHDRGDYDQLAVKYRTITKPTTKAYERLMAKHKELCDKINEIERTIHYKGTKSQFVGCKHCGSRIATEYLKSNKCPVCNHDLRPATTLNNIEKMKDNLKELRKKIRDMETKASTKAPVRWLVKIEYHV